MYNPMSKRRMLPKMKGPKKTRLKPVLIAKVYQNMVNKIKMAIAQKARPDQKSPVFSPSNTSHHAHTFL
jgi:hypothetical protein